MNPSTINILIFLCPIFIGGLIAIINADIVNEKSERAESWIRRTQANMSHKGNWFYRYIVNPVLWLMVKFSEWTDSFTHRGLKNGARLTVFLYLLVAWCFLLYVSFLLVLTIGVFVAVLYIIFHFLLQSDDNNESDYREMDSENKRIYGVSGRGRRVNPETGIIQEEGLFGYTDTDTRIDPETGKYQKQGMFGWQDTETRIDQETGKIQKEGLFGYDDTGKRIHPETGIIQEEGMFGWVDTDERIDPETGKHQKQGMFGWVDD